MLEYQLGYIADQLLHQTECEHSEGYPLISFWQCAFSTCRHSEPLWEWVLAWQNTARPQQFLPDVGLLAKEYGGRSCNAKATSSCRACLPVFLPSAPSSFTPVVYTSPSMLTATECIPPAAKCFTCWQEGRLRARFGAFFVQNLFRSGAVESGLLYHLRHSKV